eukprot:788903-Alexandrium_andersonii.AAC.1
MVIILGRATPTLYVTIRSCWVQVFMYRRPLWSLFQRSFPVYAQCEGEEAFVLPDAARSEL